MVDTPRNRTSSFQHFDVADDLKDDARDLKETATRQGEAKAAEEKDRVVRAAHSASSAMQTAADELQGDDRAPDWLASAFSSVAREVDGLASRLENKSTTNPAIRMIAAIAGKSASMPKKATPADTTETWSASSSSFVLKRMSFQPFAGICEGFFAVRPRGSSVEVIDCQSNYPKVI